MASRNKEVGTKNMRSGVTNPAPRQTSVTKAKPAKPAKPGVTTKVVAKRTKPKPPVPVAKRERDGKFAKGTVDPSGGRGGRPRGSLSLTSELRKILSQTYQDGSTRATKVMEVLCRTAESGDVQALKVLLERIDGRVADPMAQHAMPVFVIPTQWEMEFAANSKSGEPEVD